VGTIFELGGLRRDLALELSDLRAQQVDRLALLLELPGDGGDRDPLVEQAPRGVLGVLLKFLDLRLVLLDLGLEYRDLDPPGVGREPLLVDVAGRLGKLGLLGGEPASGGFDRGRLDGIFLLGLADLLAQALGFRVELVGRGGL